MRFTENYSKVPATNILEDRSIRHLTLKTERLKIQNEISEFSKTRVMNKAREWCFFS